MAKKPYEVAMHVDGMVYYRVFAESEEQARTYAEHIVGEGDYVHVERVTDLSLQRAEPSPSDA